MKKDDYKIENYFPEEPGIYLICFREGIKIGSAKNLDKRAKMYRSPWSRDIVDCFFVKTKNYKESEALVLNILKNRGNPTSPGSREFFPIRTGVDSIKSLMNRVVDAFDQGDFTWISHQSGRLRPGKKKPNKVERVYGRIQDKLIRDKFPYLFQD